MIVDIRDTKELNGDPVVLVNRFGDETVVRWFKDLWSAERNHVILSATEKGVRVYGAYLHEIPDAWLDNASAAYQSLSKDRHADVSHLATHRNRGPMNGPLVAIER